MPPYTFILTSKNLYNNLTFTTVIRCTNEKYTTQHQNKSVTQLAEQNLLQSKVCSVQQQLKSFDFGAFSVAFYVDALVDNNDIGQHSNAEKMRFHFLTCLKNEVFKPFSRSTKRSKACTSSIYFVDIFCICHRPLFEYEEEQDLKMFMANWS